MLIAAAQWLHITVFKTAQEICLCKQHASSYSLATYAHMCIYARLLILPRLIQGHIVGIYSVHDLQLYAHNPNFPRYGNAQSSFICNFCCSDMQPQQE